MINPEDEIYFQDKLRDFITQEFSTGSKNAIEAAIFLYLNKYRSYPDREIFENVKENIKTNGITPERTFSTEVRKYTNNSPQKLTVSHKKLFTVIDLEESPQRFLLIEDVRNIIDNHFSSQKPEEMFWKCPKSSCNFKEINISRNDDNIIDSKTYTAIIIHFLQHLSQKNPLFGSTDIIKIFLDHTPKGILSVEDNGEYIYDGRTSDKIWKNQIRSALNSLRSKGYIDTEDSLDIIEKFSENIKDRRKLRKRKRTDLFKTDFDLYDDWKILQSNEIIEKEKKYWLFQSNPKIYDLERAVNEINEDVFRVTRYINQIKEEDKVLFWVSGENAGLVGYGEILSDPKIFTNLIEYRDSEKYIVDESFKIESETKDILRVKVSYYPLKRKSKEEILSVIEEKQIDPSEISIFRSSQGTNFPIDKVIWDLLVKDNTAIDISEWVCPLKSCKHKKIFIDRNNGVIKTNSWEEIIIHFLQHLNKSRIYFGPSDIEKFLKRDIENMLSEADRQIYEYEDHGNEEYWRNRIRTALGPLKNQKGYIFTDKSSDDPSFRSHYQTRRRTNKFFESFTIYDDWPKKFEKLYPERKKLDTSLLDHNEIEKVHNLLLSSKQIILYGPPGTGKTYFAQVLAQKITENKYEIVQFHPSYSYEDFVEWIEAIPSEDGKSVLFQPKPRIFRNLCEIALNNPDDNVILIIDEINRGDLGRIFGELILGLEPSNRNLRIKTPLSNSLGDLRIPEKLYILATMNSVDRSIAIVDYALRRRFLFYRMMPSLNILEKWVNNPDFKLSEILKQRILSLFTNLNKKIREEHKLGKHYQIGHTFFFVKSEEELRTRWDYMIKPLLEEYLNFNEEKLSDYDYDRLIRET